MLGHFEGSTARRNKNR